MSGWQDRQSGDDATGGATKRKGPRPGYKKRSRGQIESDRAVIAEQYLQRKPLVRIGEALGLSRQMINHELKHIRAAWLASSLRDFDALKSEELARIDKLEATYWDAWERSLREQTTTTTGREKGPQGDKDTARVQKRLPVGDPRFLQGIQWCITKRCEILGLDAPTKHALTDADGEGIAGDWVVYAPRPAETVDEWAQMHGLHVDTSQLN